MSDATWLKRFSIAHYDRFAGTHDDLYHQLLIRADQRFHAGIRDIYFGKNWIFEVDGQRRRMGNAMGVEASDRQIELLFDLQHETGIEISLTMNSLVTPPEIPFNPWITHQFVQWIGSFYDRGLRSCTIASEHLMRTGLLQSRCPDMRWKSTVNHRIMDAQQLIDHATLGYDTILLDRSLNRNLRKLRQIRRAQQAWNQRHPLRQIETSLLVTESCIYQCPFKREHDALSEEISVGYWQGPANLSCNGWRDPQGFGRLPRSGINLTAVSAKTLHAFADLVDVFKFSGRLTSPSTLGNVQDLRAAWIYDPLSRTSGRSMDDVVYADAYEDIVDHDLIPLHAWGPGWIDGNETRGDWRSTYQPYAGIWSTEAGSQLEKLLMNCDNQCWDCHQCERTWGIPDVDSALEMRI